MYIKLFKNRISSASYMIRYVVSNSLTYIENEKHVILPVDEQELFNIIDTFFKAKLNEKESNG